MARKWITASRVEGDASRQAHADMPAGTYEREMSKEGFYAIEFVNDTIAYASGRNRIAKLKFK